MDGLKENTTLKALKLGKDCLIVVNNLINEAGGNYILNVIKDNDSLIELSLSMI